MNYHRYLSLRTAPVETCLVGTGDFGRSFLGRAGRVPGLSVRVAVDVAAERVVAAWRAAGVAAAKIAVCTTAAEARLAWDAGRVIAAADLAVATELPLDVVVEATGQPEAGARHARLAIEAGFHLALVSKEVDIVVGPGLAAMARAGGQVVTPIDGDQPSLLIGQVTWAETLGFTVVAAGKSSEYDFVFDERSGTLTSNARTVQALGLPAAWSLAERDVAEVLAERAHLLAAVPQRTVPDLCELLIAANALDLAPDRPDLHAPVLRIGEVPSAFATQAEGGLLSGDRRIEVFNCLRRPDEISFAGGVFVVVRCEDAASWAMLREKGHILSRSGATAMLYLPRHILGLEAATSILAAGLHGISTGAEAPRPRFDLAARADADLTAGTLIQARGHHHAIEDVSGFAVPGSALRPEAPVPYYLASGHRLARPVARGELIRLADLEVGAEGELMRLRRAQDRLFFPET